MKKMFSRLTALALCAALAAAMVPWSNAAGSGVYAYRDTVGSSTASLVAINMTEGRTGKIVLASDSVVMDDTADNLIAKGAADGTVVAAINGGFFNSYYKTSSALTFPDNCAQIYNTVIMNNHLVNAGGAKPVIGFSADGKVMIDKVGFRPTMKYANSGFTAQAWGVNYLYPNEPEAIMVFTDEMTLPVQVPASSTMIFVRDGKVTSITAGGTLNVPKGTDVIVYNSAITSIEKGYNRFPQVGEGVVISYTSTPRVAANAEAWNKMETVIGGGSILLLDGQVVTDQNPEFTQANQQPDVKAQRSFVAVNYSGNLLMGTVPNASFNEIANYLKGQGIKDAMAMDGGASSMLYVGGDGYKTVAGRRLASIMTIVDTKASSQQPSSGSSAPVFNDVPAWCAKEVDWAVENKITKGTSTTTFSPNDTCTRAQILAFIWRACSEPEPAISNPFNDVPSGEYYEKAAIWASEKGFIGGTSLSPNSPCRRYEVVMYLWQLAGMPAQESTSGFSDVAPGSAYDQAVAWAVSQKITDGTSPTTFSPNDTCTRGQIACFLYRYLAK